MSKSKNPVYTFPNVPLIQVDQILHQIEHVTGKFERAAVESAVRRQEEATPELLRILENVVKRSKEIDAEGNYVAHLYAMFLLAQFREARAYPLLVQFALLDSNVLYSLCGDFLTENFGRILASVSGGELRGMQSIIVNEEANEWVRGATLDGLLTLVVEGQMTRDKMVRYLLLLFRTLEREPSQLWNALVAASCDIYPYELLHDIRLAYRRGLVDRDFLDMEDVKRDLSMGKGWVLARLAGNPRYRMVREVAREMESSVCFR